MFDASMWGDVIALAGLIAVAYVAAVWLSLIVWTYRDVRHRSADTGERLAAVTLVALFFVPGWLVYLLMRPAGNLDDIRIERLQEQLFARELAAVSSCTRCRRRIEDDFLVCPYCREQLRTPCDGCGRGIARTWDACAYCGESVRRRAAPATTPRTAAAAGAQAVPAPRPLVPTEAS